MHMKATISDIESSSTHQLCIFLTSPIFGEIAFYSFRGSSFVFCAITSFLFFRSEWLVMQQQMLLKLGKLRLLHEIIFSWMNDMSYRCFQVA